MDGGRMTEKMEAAMVREEIDSTLGIPVTEEELVAKATAPRVSLDRLEGLIATTQFVQPKGTTLTLCILTTHSGFTFVGKSAAASTANFDPVIGGRLARQDAIRQMWEPEGYMLRAIQDAKSEGAAGLAQFLTFARQVNGGDLTPEDTVRAVLDGFWRAMTGENIVP